MFVWFVMCYLPTQMNKNKYTQSVCKHLDDKMGKLQDGFGGRNITDRYTFLIVAYSWCHQKHLDLKKHLTL